jgi:hypothetical protein
MDCEEDSDLHELVGDRTERVDELTHRVKYRTLKVRAGSEVRFESECWRAFVRLAIASKGTRA